MNEELKARLSLAVENLVKVANARNEQEGLPDGEWLRKPELLSKWHDEDITALKNKQDKNDK